MFFGSKQFFWLKAIFSKGAYEDIEINKKSQNFIPGLYLVQLLAGITKKLD